MSPNSQPQLNIVTGAYGYMGKYITRRLLAQGKQVKTLTNHPHRSNEFGDKVQALPFNFDRYADLVASLQGATTLYNTYWVRFNYGSTRFDQGVENTRTLFKAAKEAGVKRFVHTSILKPDPNSPLPYYKGKGQLEEALKQSGLSYAILQPTVVFGLEDVLINNIAWLVRRFPLFGVPGNGEYQLQPIFVEDIADIAVEAGQSTVDQTIETIGPEIYSFNALVKLIADKLHKRVKIFHAPPKLALLMSQFISIFVRDVILTQEEVDGLMANLLVSTNPPTGRTHLSEWLEQNADVVGKQYASEVGRHFRK
jgi:NADH dehydrogenase